VGIEPARFLWLRSYLTGRIQRIRIGHAVFKDISVTSGFIWFVNRISVIFDYVRVLFYANEAVSSCQKFSGLYENSVESE
jgi:hypothetical protein